MKVKFLSARLYVKDQMQLALFDQTSADVYKIINKEEFEINNKISLDNIELMNEDETITGQVSILIGYYNSDKSDNNVLFDISVREAKEAIGKNIKQIYILV